MSVGHLRVQTGQDDLRRDPHWHYRIDGQLRPVQPPAHARFAVRGDVPGCGMGDAATRVWLYADAPVTGGYWGKSRHRSVQPVCDCPEGVVVEEVISPGLMLPSGSMLSHRSHTVVAPIVTGYNQEGHSVWSKSW